MKKKILITLSTLIGLYLLWDVVGYIQFKQASNAYQECLRSPGSTNIEPIPPVCWYEDGREVVGPSNPVGLMYTLFE